MEQHKEHLDRKVDFEDEESIDWVAILQTLWKGRKIILWGLLGGFVVGLVVAFSTPNQYTARTVLVPQVKSSAKSSLSSLASLAGVDLGMAESAELSPLIYPQIVSSIPFNLELMNTPVHFAGVDTAVSVYEYYTNIKKPNLMGVVAKYTIGLPMVLKGWIMPKKEALQLPKGLKNAPLSMTEEQLAIKKMFDEKVALAVEQKNGYLTLSVNMGEPLVAAELAEVAQQMLQQFITNFKIEKSKAELDFIQERYNIAKAEAEGYQYGMASNLDKYKDLTSNVPQVSNTRLQTKYSIANSVYTELAKQLEQAKIQVKKDTPVFTVIEPVSIPQEKSNKGKATIILMYLMLGIFLGLCIIFSKTWLTNNIIKLRIQTEE